MALGGPIKPLAHVWCSVPGFEVLCPAAAARPLTMINVLDLFPSSQQACPIPWVSGLSAGSVPRELLEAERYCHCRRQKLLSVLRACTKVSSLRTVQRYQSHVYMSVQAWLSL